MLRHGFTQGNRQAVAIAGGAVLIAIAGLQGHAVNLREQHHGLVAQGLHLGHGLILKAGDIVLFHQAGRKEDAGQQDNHRHYHDAALYLLAGAFVQHRMAGHLQDHQYQH